MSTASWRTERPVYEDFLPPCNASCPAGENIQAWMQAAATGEYERAWRTLVENNPLPAVMGRVCYHPCEGACNRAEKDERINIHAVERFLGDEAIRKGWKFQAGKTTGKNVLVVGSGPAGLAAAYHLARLGHSVTIFESGPAAGGMLRVGIPAYRLPREILDAEIARIAAMGVKVRLNTRIECLSKTMEDGEFDAAFLAVGAHIAKRAQIPGADGRVLDALSFLNSVDRGQPPALGKRVIVYGGGNTALDAARTAKRLGSAETLIVYRRNREKMPAHDFEVQEAIDEGIKLKWLSTITKADGTTFTIEKMKLDEKGFPQPTGEFETLEADCVILALGQNADLSSVDGLRGVEIIDGVVKVNAHMTVGHPGIFAGGDMVEGERTATVAVGHGKKAARNIDAFLRGETYTPAPKHARATFGKINTMYYPDLPEALESSLSAGDRSNFDEVVSGLDETNARYEAKRCLSCGNCFECDTCFNVCPDQAVKKLGAGQRYEFDYETCQGCGLCASECPCGAIEMVAEQN